MGSARDVALSTSSKITWREEWKGQEQEQQLSEQRLQAEQRQGEQQPRRQRTGCRRPSRTTPEFASRPAASKSRSTPRAAASPRRWPCGRTRRSACLERFPLEWHWRLPHTVCWHTFGGVSDLDGDGLLGLGETERRAHTEKVVGGALHLQRSQSITHTSQLQVYTL